MPRWNVAEPGPTRAFERLEPGAGKLARRVPRGGGSSNGVSLLDNIRNYGDKLLIKPARKNVRSFQEKVRDLVKS